MCPPTKLLFSSSDNTGTVRVEGHASIFTENKEEKQGVQREGDILYRDRTLPICLFLSLCTALAAAVCSGDCLSRAV